MRLMRNIFRLFLLLSCLLVYTGTVLAQGSEVRIGVLANKGNEQALTAWQPLADYLEQAVPGRHFAIKPFGFAGLYPAIERGDMEFVILNTGQYVEMEVASGISRVATIRNIGPGGLYTVFGGVLIAKAGREDLKDMRDLKGQRVWAVDETSLGGWLAQLREIKAAGMEPAQFAELKHAGNHEAIVRAVLAGKADVGAVRTDTLERMVLTGELDLQAVKIVNERQTLGFPFKHSTRLYPEWPFAKLRHTDNGLAQQVAVALLQLPGDSPAAKAAMIGGWTIPADYSSVHTLYQELKLGPYHELGKFSLLDVLKKYWPVIALSVLLILVLAVAAVLILKTNRRLESSFKEIEQQKQTIEATLAELNQTHAELNQANTFLVESIQYARRIQESMLPNSKVLGDVLADVAVYWEPLNVVGGDYYRLEKTDDKCLIIVADCTGHGVPGAMLTMVLASVLERIIHDQKAASPAAILKSIDEQMRVCLHQDTPDAQSDDGLEASVCLYDLSTRELVYAGVGIPLLIIDNEQQIQQIKAVVGGLGYSTGRRPQDFTEHVIAVKAGMKFYLFTDGCSDQMGGNTRRLLGRKRLAALLAEHQTDCLGKQIEAVCRELEVYRESEARRDDMTMVAFRPL